MSSTRSSHTADFSSCGQQMGPHGKGALLAVDVGLRLAREERFPDRWVALPSPVRAAHVHFSIERA